MRAIECCVATAILVAVGGSPNAAVESEGLSNLKEALSLVRATKPTDPDRDAGPELTPVKQALRHWVESQLPSPEVPGRVEGTLNIPSPESLEKLTARLNAALDESGLTCGDFDSASYRCAAPMLKQETQRGYIGGVRLGLLDGGSRQLLLLVTGVGVLCGEDQSVYVYEPRGSSWRLIFASEQDDYRRGIYAPQNITEVAVSPIPAESEKPVSPPLIATLGFAPWCSSTWSSLFTRLWRLSPATVTPKPLIDRRDGLWWGNEDFGSAQLTASDFLVQYTDASMDSGVQSRKHVRHYQVYQGYVKRIDPVALRPMDFVDEWLTTDWKEASRWIDSSGDLSVFERAHQKGPSEYDDTGKRCRGNRSLWQVSLEGGRYFQVKWAPPYVFRLVAVSTRPFRGCDVADPLADDENATLFPDTQWHP